MELLLTQSLESVPRLMELMMQFRAPEYLDRASPDGDLVDIRNYRIAEYLEGLHYGVCDYWQRDKLVSQLDMETTREVCGFVETG